MAAMKKLLLAALVAAFAAFIGHRVLKIRKITLASREVTPKHLDCHFLKGIEYGAEDITILGDGLAFISAGLKYPGMPSFSDEPGKIYLMDLLNPKPSPVELQMEGELDLRSFNPHGISVYTHEPDGSVYLFVVNHPQHRSQVEIFRWAEGKTLVHLRTVVDPLLHSVNDVVAVGPESFYATNDHFFPDGVLHMLAVFLGLSWCDVVFFGPEGAKVAAAGFLSANGINVSPDQRYVYVSDILEHEVDVFRRQEGERLAYVKSVHVGSLCDNIEVEPETGDLWLGCHPNPMKLNKFDPEDPPGSEVIQVKDVHSRRPAVIQVYVDDGSEIMASSVAAPYGGKLLIGTVFHRALRCDLR